jgi:hypothetical protein
MISSYDFGFVMWWWWVVDDVEKRVEGGLVGK